MKELLNFKIFDNVKKIQDKFKRINFTSTTFKKGEVIAYEGERCFYVGFILDGLIEVQNITIDGNITSLNRLSKLDMFGEILLFSESKRYPANILAITDTKVILVNNESLIELLLSDPTILKNYLNLISNRVFTLNNRVKILSQPTLKEKIMQYLLSERVSQQSNVISIHMTKEKLAKYLGCERPSLSRTLSELKDEGVIDYDRKTITIK